MRKTTTKRVLESCRNDDPILSIYVNVDRGRKAPKEIQIDLKNLIREAGRRTEGLGEERGRRFSAHLEGALADLMPRIESRPGWALFVSESGLRECLPLPAPVANSATLAPRPRLYPLLAVLSPHREALLCLLDPARARFYEVWGDQATLLWEIEEGPVRRDRDPGRIPREGEEEARKQQDRVSRHVRAAAVRARELFEARPGAQAILLGGARPLCEEGAALLGESVPVEILDPTPSPKGGASASPAEGAEALPALLRSHAMRRFWEEGETLAARILSEASRGGSALGWRSTLAAASRGAIHTLLIEETETVRGRHCGHCGALGLDEPYCPICHSATDPDGDLLESLIARTLEKEGEAIVLGRPSALREAGGVGSLLRYPL